MLKQCIYTPQCHAVLFHYRSQFIIGSQVSVASYNGINLSINGRSNTG
jgi:hypothetical protein